MTKASVALEAALQKLAKSLSEINTTLQYELQVLSKIETKCLPSLIEKITGEGIAHLDKFTPPQFTTIAHLEEKTYPILWRTALQYIKESLKLQEIKYTIPITINETKTVKYQLIHYPPTTNVLPSPKYESPSTRQKTIQKTLKSTANWLSTKGKNNKPEKTPPVLRWDGKSKPHEELTKGIIATAKIIAELAKSGKAELDEENTIITNKEEFIEKLEEILKNEGIDPEKTYEILESIMLITTKNDKIIINGDYLTSILAALSTMPGTKESPWPNYTMTPPALNPIESSSLTAGLLWYNLSTGLPPIIRLIWLSRTITLSTIGAVASLIYATHGVTPRTTETYPTLPVSGTPPQPTKPIQSLTTGYAPSQSQGNILTIPTSGLPTGPHIVGTTSTGTPIEFNLPKFINKTIETLKKASLELTSNTSLTEYTLGVMCNFTYNISSIILIDWKKYIGTNKTIKIPKITTKPVTEQIPEDITKISSFMEKIIYYFVKITEKTSPYLEKAEDIMSKYEKATHWIPTVMASYASALLSESLLKALSIFAKAIVKLGLKVLEIMSVTLETDIKSTVKWIYNRIATMYSYFGMYFSQAYSELIESGFISTVEVPISMLTLYSYCCIWPKCEVYIQPSPKREYKKPECEPKSPEKPRLLNYDCVIGSVMKYLSGLYKIQHDIIEKILKEKKELPQFRQELLFPGIAEKIYKISNVNPGYYPLSALIWWANVVAGTWVWVIQYYGALAGLSLANCMGNSWKVLRGHRDKEFKMLEPKIPHIKDRRQVVRWWYGATRYAVEKAHKEFGKKVSGIEIEKIITPKDVDKILKTMAAFSRITFTKEDYSEIGDLWMGGRIRKLLPKKTTLRAVHPASSKGAYNVDKSDIADTITALLIAAYIITELAKEKAHPGTHGLKSDKKTTYVISTALAGWAYGHYGFMAIGQGKLYGKFNPEYTKITIDLTEAIIKAKKIVEEIKKYGKTKAEINEKWHERVKSIMRIAYFTIHSYLSWRIYGTGKILEGSKAIKAKDNRYKNDKLFITGLNGNTLARGLSPECVDRFSTAVILGLVLTLHSFLYRIIAKISGRTSHKLKVKTEKYHEGKKTTIEIRSPYLPLFPLDGLTIKNTYTRKEDIVSLPGPETALRATASLFEGYKAWKRKWDKSAGKSTVLTERPLRVISAKSWYTEEGVRTIEDTHQRILEYYPPVKEILSQYRERKPCSLPAVWGTTRRIVSETTFSCDPQESNSEESITGTPEPPQEEPKAEWDNVNHSEPTYTEEDAPQEPEVPTKPPEPPEPPKIEEMLPKPPKPSSIKCPGETPRPPEPPSLPKPPQPPNIEPPKWNPPKPPWPKLNPPQISPPEIPEKISPYQVQQYLQDYFCSIIKYIGETAEYLGTLVQTILTGGPTYIVELISSTIDYIQNMMKFVSEKAIPNVIEYTFNVLGWIIDLPKEILNLTTQYANFFKNLVNNYLPSLASYIIKCVINTIKSSPGTIINYIKELIKTFEKLLDPTLWYNIIKQITEYMKEMESYVEKLIVWFVKYTTVWVLGTIYFIQDIINELADKLKQTLNYATRTGILDPQWILTSWSSSFIEQYCGPDVLNSWRAGFYTIWNTAATAPRKIRNGIITLINEAQNRDLLYRSFYLILEACRLFKENLPEYYNIIKNKSKELISKFAQNYNPEVLQIQATKSYEDLIKTIEEISNKVQEEEKETVNNALKMINESMNIFNSLYITGLIYWDYQPQNNEKSQEQNTILSGLAHITTEEGENGEKAEKIEGSIVGISEIIHDLFIERFDAWSCAYDMIGPFLIMSRSLSNYPIKRWLFPIWKKTVRLPKVYIDRIRVFITTIWGTTVGTWWYRIYKLSEWTPMLKITQNVPETYHYVKEHVERLFKIPQKVAQEISSRFEEYVTSPVVKLYTQYRKTLWEIQSIMAESASKLFGILSNIHEQSKNLINMIDYVSNMLNSIYWYLLIRKYILEALEEFTSSTGSTTLKQLYTELCNIHNNQVNKYNEVIKQWNEIINQVEKMIKDIWSTVTMIIQGM